MPQRKISTESLQSWSPRTELADELINFDYQVDPLNPLKGIQTQIAQTRRQQIINNRRKNFQNKKKTEVIRLSLVFILTIMSSYAKTMCLEHLARLELGARLLMARRS